MSDFNSLKTDLLFRLKMGDEAAFKEIYMQYWKLLFHIACKRVQSQEIAEEIVQNIFIDLWAQRKVKNIQNLKYYLTSCVRYSVINHIKNLLVQEKYNSHLKNIKESEINPIEQQFYLKELNERIEICISKLPKKTQNIFRLSRYELLTNKEIAQNFNMSEKAVEYHITQSLKSLRLFLKDYILYLPLLYNISFFL